MHCRSEKGTGREAKRLLWRAIGGTDNNDVDEDDAADDNDVNDDDDDGVDNDDDSIGGIDGFIRE